MKPGDTVKIVQPDGFVTLFAKPGPVALTVGGGTSIPEVYQMQPEDVGLVLAVNEIPYDEVSSATECLVLVATGDGDSKMGWRETTQFEVVE
jgi:hypothetical protein